MNPSHNSTQKDKILWNKLNQGDERLLQGGEMPQALYAHMNNKTIKKKERLLQWDYKTEV
jgi:hypothetical protein